MGMSHSCSEKQSSEKNEPTNRWQKNKTPNARDLEHVGVEKSQELSDEPDPDKILRAQMNKQIVK